MRGRTWGLIREHRDLRLLFLSNFFWSCGAMLYTFVWPNYVRDLGGTAREIGFLSALMFATVAVTLLPGGWLADRYERKRLMIATWGLAAFAPLVYAVAQSWEGLIPGAILYCIFVGWPAMEAYLADSVPPEAISRAFTLTAAGFSLGAIASPLLGAWLLPMLGMRGLFGMAFGFFLLSTGALALMSPQRPRPHPPEARPPWFLRDGRLIAWTALFVLASWGSAAVRPFLPTYLEDALGFPRSWILASSSLLALGEVLWAAPLGRLGDRDGAGAITGGLGLVAAGCLLLFGGMWAVAPAMLLLGGDRVTASVMRSGIGRRAGARRGTVFGGTLVLANAAQALGPLAGSRLYEVTPAGPLYLAAGLAAGLALLVWLGRGRAFT